MVTKKQNSKQYIRDLNIIHFALILGQVVIALIALLLNFKYTDQAINVLRDILIYVVPIFILNGFVTGYLLFKSQLGKVKNYDNLLSKLEGYKSSLVTRFALLEGASLLAIAAYFLTEDFIFLGMSGIVIAYFFILKPSIEKISKDLGLNSTEIMTLNNVNEIIT